ncbi:MAG: hypothetical protein AABX93_01720 [Nanoarchaeota archaeon]
MTNRDNFYKFISGIFLIVAIVFIVLYFNKSPVLPEIEQKALMFGVLNSWGENLYNSSEYLFSVDVYNFGYDEAKNVELECSIYVGDSEGNLVSDSPVTIVTENVGNIASTSYKYGEPSAPKNFIKEGNNPVALCSVKSCENCEILNGRIPDLDY